jgi:hypothetical protein
VEKKREESKKKRRGVDGPHYCISCDEDPCAFVQIETRLCDNDGIYFVSSTYEKEPVGYNRVRQERAY